MIKLNTNEKKRLKFNIELSGVQPNDLKGSMKIISDGVEYGFPIGLDGGKVVVEIKPLSEISNLEFKDGQSLPARLEIIANETFLIPWSDTIRIENPIKVEAKIDEVEEVTETIVPKIKIAAVEEESLIKEEKPKPRKKRKPKSLFGKMLDKE